MKSRQLLESPFVGRNINQEIIKRYPNNSISQQMKRYQNLLLNSRLGHQGIFKQTTDFESRLRYRQKNNSFISFPSSAFDGTGLKAYWQFNEASGNLINNANLVSNNATLGSAADGTNTSVSYSQSGIIGNSYGYTYASSSKSVIGSSLSQFDFLHNTTAKWSMNFWYKFKTNPPFSDDNHIFFSSSSSGSAIGLSTYIVANARTLDIRFNGVSSTDLVTSTIFPIDTSFHMLTLTYDESLGSSNLLVYLDGSLHDTINKSGTRSNSDATQALTLGLGFSTLYGYNGYFDEWSVFANRILSSTEITTIYGGGSGFQLY